MKRGPKSRSEIAVVSSLEDQRPPPPDGLTAPQSILWVSTAGRLPHGWFPPETWEQLSAYCRHAISARDLSQLIDAFEAEWLKAEGGPERLDRFMKMRDRETRAMLACARSLRITNQSRQDPKTAGRAARNSTGLQVLPWEPDQQIIEGDRK